MNNHIVSYGRSITSSADRLDKVSLERVYKALIAPKPDIASRVRNLRIAYSVDKKRYAELKKQLPYIVCAVFNPSFRKVENFAYTEYFIVDIDHLCSKGINLMNLRQNIETDPRVLLTFASPSEDGLKVFFRLKERCHDSGIYTLFYKMFVAKFSAMYQIDQVVDTRTSDVSRACFISVDPQAYYNADAVAVDINDFLDQDNPQSLFDAKSHFDRVEKEERKLNRAPKPDSEKDPDADIIASIRERLGLKTRPVRKTPAFVPAQLNDIIGEIKNHVEQTGITVTEVIDIQYGKKIRMKMGLNLSEVNVFYGRRGYSVVISPRSGTSASLNELCADVINGFFAEREIL